ncbi:MAG: hypothetical protein AB7T06_40070 [Kofleriaceae bacterium]
MNILVILFLLLAIVLFLIAAFVPVPRVNLIALGLASFALAFLIPQFA